VTGRAPGAAGGVPLPYRSQLAAVAPGAAALAAAPAGACRNALLRSRMTRGQVRGARGPRRTPHAARDLR